MPEFSASNPTATLPATPASTVAESRRDWLLGAILVVSVLVVYIPAYHAGFLLDDDLLLTANPLIKSASGWWRVWWTTQTPDYLPVMSDSFWIEWRMFGMDPAGYHVLNIIQHAVSTVLLWLALRRIGVPGAWYAALLFGIHPVNVRSVAWIAERKNTLSIMFYLLTIIAFVKSEDLKDRRYYALSLILFVLALLSKSSTIVLPAVLLLIAWYRRREITRADLVAIAPFAVLSLAACCTTIWFQNAREIAPAHVAPDPFVWRIASSGMAVWFYLGKLIAPVNLAMIYPRWTIDTASPVSFLPVALAAAVWAALYSLRKGVVGGVYAAFTYYVLTLLPVIGFVNMAFFKSSMVSDHLQYISTIGIASLAGAAIAYGIRSRTGAARAATATVAVLVACASGFLAFTQASLYTSRETLANDTLQTNPNSFWAHGERANAMLARNDIEGAKQELIIAHRLNPDSLGACNNLGTVYMQDADYGDAIAMFQAAVNLAPNNIPIRKNLGAAYFHAGDLAQARVEFEKIHALAPGDAWAINAIATLDAAAARSPTAKR